VNAGTVSGKYLTLVLVILGAIIIACARQSVADGGGSDDEISIEASVGGSGVFAWNESHGFVIKEEGTKINDEFDVIICEDVKYNDTREKHEPIGHIYGELHDIRWDDEPPPYLIICREDFEEYKNDQNNITVIIYGEYEVGPGQTRYAYLELNITKPNNSPIAVVHMALEDSWNWSKVNETWDATYFSEADDLRFRFNGSSSWDPDDEEIIAWNWDLDEDGRFGYLSRERGMNVSMVLTPGRTYRLGLMVKDERGKTSNIQSFTINVLLKTESGGTDQHIRIYGFAGTTSEFDWNEIHNFVIRENGEKIEEQFNVTICKDISWNGSQWIPAAPFFGNLTNIHYDHEPEPLVTISRKVFEDNKDDTLNLTLFIFGSYHSSEGYRYAYKRIIMQRENLPPTPIVWVAEDGKWNWWNLSSSNEVIFLIEEDYEKERGEREEAEDDERGGGGKEETRDGRKVGGEKEETGDEDKEIGGRGQREKKGPGDNQEKRNITLWFDASNSWDPDFDTIARWEWRLENNGKFGNKSYERIANTSGSFGVGNYYLGLRLYDGIEYSPEFYFIIRIKNPIREPDLIPLTLEIENQELGKDHFDKGDVIIFNFTLKNTGRNWTTPPIDVLVEYKLHENGTWNYLIGIIHTQPLAPGESIDLGWEWDTNFELLVLGDYIIRIVIDPYLMIQEENETNNSFLVDISLVDKIPPSVEVFELEDPEKVIGVVKIQGSVWDNVRIERVEYRILGKDNWTMVEGTENWWLELNTTRLKDGRVTLEFRAYDGIQYSEVETLILSVENDEDHDDSQVPISLYVFIFSLVLLTVAVAFFMKDPGRKNKVF